MFGKLVSNFYLNIKMKKDIAHQNSRKDLKGKILVIGQMSSEEKNRSMKKNLHKKLKNLTLLALIGERNLKLKTTHLNSY